METQSLHTVPALVVFFICLFCWAGQCYQKLAGEKFIEGVLSLGTGPIFYYFIFFQNYNGLMTLMAVISVFGFFYILLKHGVNLAYAFFVPPFIMVIAWLFFHFFHWLNSF